MTYSSMAGNAAFNLAPFKRIETDITGVLDSLFFAFDTAKALHADIRALDELLQPEKIAEIASHRDAVARALREVDGSGVATQELVEQLRSESMCMARTLREMSQTIQSSSIISLNARIIAQAHIQSPGGSHLVRLAENISEISRVASSQAAEMTTVVSDISASILDMGNAAEQRAALLVKTLKPRAEAMSSALVALEQGCTAARQASEWLTSYMERASRDISGVISALQIGDRSRQRVEHIETILTLAASPSRSGTEARILRFLATEQTRDTLSLVRADATKALDRLVALEAQMPAFLEHCELIQNAFRSGLPDSPEEVRAEELTALEQKTTLTDQARARLASLEEALETHAGALSDSAFQMCLASLNTIITCARGFRGAHDMIVTSQQINEVISQIPSNFETFLESMARTNDHLDQWSALNQRQSGMDIDTMWSNFHILEEIRAVLEKLLPEISHVPDTISREISGSATRFARFSQDIEALSDLPQATGGIDPDALQVRSAEFEQTLALIRSQYTMQEERDLHDAVLQTTETGKAERSEEESLEDIFF